jgi:hypothetical protein
MGLAVYVGEHSAMFPGDPFNHIAIVLKPDNPSDFPCGTPSTLGGQAFGPNNSSNPLDWDPFGDLHSYPNYPGDSPSNLNNLTPVPTPPGMTDTQFIQALINASNSYNNSLPYAPFPQGGAYNSDSYASGIIDRAGGAPPNLPGLHPGYDHPIPPSASNSKPSSCGH